MIEHTQMNDEYFVTILVVQNEVEAMLIDSILNEREIPHVMRTYHHLALDGIFQVHKGWGQVDAPESFRQEITEIYADLPCKADIPDKSEDGTRRAHRDAEENKNEK